MCVDCTDKVKDYIRKVLILKTAFYIFKRLFLLFWNRKMSRAYFYFFPKANKEKIYFVFNGHFTLLLYWFFIMTIYSIKYGKI